MEEKDRRGVRGREISRRRVRESEQMRTVDSVVRRDFLFFLLSLLFFREVRYGWYKVGRGREERRLTLRNGEGIFGACGFFLVCIM